MGEYKLEEMAKHNLFENMQYGEPNIDSYMNKYANSGRLRAIVACLFARSRNSVIVPILEKYPLSRSEILTTTRKYIELYPQDKYFILASKYEFDLDKPILSYVKLEYFYSYCERDTRYEHIKDLEEVIYTFGDNIQKQIDKSLCGLWNYSYLCNKEFYFNNLWAEGPSKTSLMKSSALNSKKQEINIWWNSRIEEYRDIKLWLLFEFPDQTTSPGPDQTTSPGQKSNTSVQIPSDVVNLIISYMPWNKNVTFDPMFTLLLNRVQKLEKIVYNNKFIS